VRGEDTSRPAVLPAFRPDFFGRVGGGIEGFLWAHRHECEAIEVDRATSALPCGP